jgi:hypothetical protein
MTLLTQCHSTVCRHAYLPAADKQALEKSQWGVGLTGTKMQSEPSVAAVLGYLTFGATHHLTAQANLRAETKQNDSAVTLYGEPACYACWSKTQVLDTKEMRGTMTRQFGSGSGKGKIVSDWPVGRG